MKIFENKSLFKKIVIIMLFITVAGFCFSGYVQASDGEIKGGKLLSPIADLLNAVGDAIMHIVHNIIYKQDSTTIEVDMVRGIEQAFWVGLGIIVVIAAIVITGGIVSGLSTALVKLLPKLFAKATIGTILAYAATAGVVAGAYFTSNVMPDNLHLPIYQITPEAIFSNKILLFDVNFFDPAADDTLKDENGKPVKDDDGNVITQTSIAKELRTIVSSWYNVLRDIAIVILLSVLVYVGIRIVISSTAGDKAKYKQMITDWVVAICLLFLMQYIMAFSNIIVSKLTEVVKTIVPKNGYIAVLEDEHGYIKETLEEIGYDQSSIKEHNERW